MPSDLLFFVLLPAMLLLLPLVVSLVLYRFVPSDTVVSGPFKGLNIKLTGAFGAYFLTVLVLVGVFYDLVERRESRRLAELEKQYEERIAALRDRIANSWEMWQLQGTVAVPQLPSGTVVSPHGFTLVLRPPKPHFEPDQETLTARFYAQVPIKAEEGGPLTSYFDNAIFEYDGFHTESVPLTRETIAHWKARPEERELIMEEPIVIDDPQMELPATRGGRPRQALTPAEG